MKTTTALAPILLLAALALPGAGAPAARAADEITLPLPSIRWNPVESAATVPNTGSRDGLPDAASPYALLLKKKLFTAASPGVALVTAEGAGPFQKGRAIDLSSNPLMGNTPGNNPGPSDPELALVGAINGMNLGGLPAFTLCLWYKIDSPFTTAAATILRYDGGLSLQLRPSGDLRLDVYSDTAQTTGLGNLVTPRNAALTRQGQWVFLAVTWDGATGDAAIHFGAEDRETAELKAGTLRATGKLRGTAPNGNPANALNLGYNNNANATNSFDGWFADVRLYNTALTPAQLEKIRAPAAPPSGSPFAAPPAQRH